MGDRANCVIRRSDAPDVWLYTHWAGTELPHTVQSALQRKQRWEDESYLARIIFCEMIKGNEAEETGFGISSRQQDNNHKFVVVHITRQEVMLYGRKSNAMGSPEVAWSFQDFIALTDAQIDEAYSRGEE